MLFRSYSSQPQSTSKRGSIITVVPKTITTRDNPGISGPSNGTIYTGDWYLAHTLGFTPQRLVMTSNKPSRGVGLTFQILSTVVNGTEITLTDEIVVPEIRYNPQDIQLRGATQDLGAIMLRLTMEYQPIDLELYVSLELLGSEVTN